MGRPVVPLTRAACDFHNLSLSDCPFPSPQESVEHGAASSLWLNFVGNFCNHQQKVFSVISSVSESITHLILNCHLKATMFIKQMCAMHLMIMQQTEDKVVLSVLKFKNVTLMG